MEIVTGGGRTNVLRNLHRLGIRSRSIGVHRAPVMAKDGRPLAVGLGPHGVLSVYPVTGRAEPRRDQRVIRVAAAMQPGGLRKRRAR